MVRCNSIEASTRSSMADFVDSEFIHSSELRDNDDQAARKFVCDAYSRLVQTTSEHSAKLVSMEAMLFETKNTLSQICNQLGIHPIEAETSRHPLPVPYSDPYIRDNHNRFPLDNSESLMPGFDGSNASDWLLKVERFFSVGRYSDLDKLDLVAFSLEGYVLQWFSWEMSHKEFRSWDEFRRRLLLKFGAASEKSSENVAEILEEKAAYSEKKGTVSASVIESAELSSHVIGLDESHLEQLFSNGLQTEMQAVLKLPEPMGLENHKPAGTFTSTPVASVNSISFAVGTEETIFSGLSQTSQVWEPGGVLAEHVLVDFIVAAQLAEKYAEESEESLDGTEDVVPVAARGPEVPNELLFGTMDNTLHLLEMGFSKHEISMAIDKIGTEGQISPTLSENCTQVLLEPRMQVTEALVNARLAKKPIILTNWVKLIAEKSICSEIPGYYRPSVRVGDALLDVVTTPVIDDAIFQFVLDRTVSREWHRWKHKTAYDGVIAANVLVDWLVDFNGYDGIVDGIRRLAIDSRRASRVWERGGLDISTVVSFNLQSYSSWCGWRVFDRGKNNKWDAHVDSLISSMLPSYAQDIMKRQADKKRRNVEFSVGDWVYIKLQPYRQLSVMHRIHQKLAAKFFDFFLVIELIGMVASKLADCISLYPISKLEDKLVFEGESIDTIPQSYCQLSKAQGEDSGSEGGFAVGS